MKRTKLPIKKEAGIKKIDLNEIYEDLPNSQKRELLEITQQIETRTKSIKINAYEIGGLLFRANKILPYGYFGPWIKETFQSELPYSTAYFYMKIYDRFKGDPKAVLDIPITYLLMMSSKAFPEVLIKEICENSKEIHPESLKQIKQSYKELKEGKMGNSAFIKIARQQIVDGIELYKGKDKHRRNRNARMPLHFGTKDVLEKINALIDTAKDMANLYPYDPQSQDHKELIKFIDDTNEALLRLKSELEGGQSLIKPISTEEGDQFI